MLDSEVEALFSLPLLLSVFSKLCCYYIYLPIPCSLTAYPTQVAITGTGARYINMTWLAPTEVYSPIVKYSINCTGRGGNSVTDDTRDGTVVSFILQGVRPYTSYTCCVMTVTQFPGGSASCAMTTTNEDSES